MFLKGLLASLKKRPEHVVPPPRGVWDISMWNPEDVTSWLSLFGLNRRLARFRNVDGNGLLDMPFDVLSHLVDSKHEAKTIIKELMKLQSVPVEQREEEPPAVWTPPEEEDATSELSAPDSEPMPEPPRVELQVHVEPMAVLEVASDYMTACERVMAWYNANSKGSELTVSAMVEELSISVNLAHDIMNVYEALEIVIPKMRKGKGYSWRGTSHIGLLVESLRTKRPADQKEAKSAGSIGEVARLFTRLVSGARGGIRVGAAADAIIEQFRDEKTNMEESAIEQLHCWLVEQIHDIVQIMASVQLVVIPGDDMVSLTEPENSIAQWIRREEPASEREAPGSATKVSNKMHRAHMLFDKPGEAPTPCTPRHLITTANSRRSPSKPWLSPHSSGRPVTLRKSANKNMFKSPSPSAASYRPPVRPGPVVYATSSIASEGDPEPQHVPGARAAQAFGGELEEPHPAGQENAADGGADENASQQLDRTVSNIRNRFESPGKASAADNKPEDFSYGSIRNRFEKSRGGSRPMPTFPKGVPSYGSPAPARASNPLQPSAAHQVSEAAPLGDAKPSYAPYYYNASR